MKYYKLTDQNNRTTNHTQWGEGVTQKAVGKGQQLCSADVIHVYDHPLKAAIFNPIHADIKNPRLWEVRVKRVVANDNTKVGVKSCTTIKQIPLPEITTNQRVRFAIYCALKVYSDAGFVKWANGWLDGTDRTAYAAAYAATYAATYASYAATYAANAANAAAHAANGKIDLVKLITRAIREEVTR
jgi:hypothetical protein